MDCIYVFLSQLIVRPLLKINENATLSVKGKKDSSFLKK